MLYEYSVVNRAVTLHALKSGAGPSEFAVGVVPGLSETADDWRELLEYLAPLHTAAITLRGRGRSSAPAAGYSLAHHTSDVAAFVEQIQAESVLLVAFSRSVGYALEYATLQSNKLAGLVLLDYAPKHTELPPTWAERFAESSWRSRKASSIVSLPVLQAIAKEADAKDFTPHLSSLLLPTLVVRGGMPGAALSASGAAEYTNRLPHCRVAVLDRSSHALWEPNASDLYREIATFARGVASEA